MYGELKKPTLKNRSPYYRSKLDLLGYWLVLSRIINLGKSIAEEGRASASGHPNYS